MAVSLGLSVQEPYVAPGPDVRSQKRQYVVRDRTCKGGGLKLDGSEIVLPRVACVRDQGIEAVSTCHPESCASA